MEFNTKTRTGTFYNAAGTAVLGDQGESADRSIFGSTGARRLLLGRDDRQARAQEIQDHDGGFTTCVQPTPRWESSPDR